MTLTPTPTPTPTRFNHIRSSTTYYYWIHSYTHSLLLTASHCFSLLLTTMTMTFTMTLTLYIVCVRHVARAFWMLTRALSPPILLYSEETRIPRTRKKTTMISMFPLEMTRKTKKRVPPSSRLVLQIIIWIYGWELEPP